MKFISKYFEALRLHSIRKDRRKYGLFIASIFTSIGLWGVLYANFDFDSTWGMGVLFVCLLIVRPLLEVFIENLNSNVKF